MAGAAVQARDARARLGGVRIGSLPACSTRVCAVKAPSTSGGVETTGNRRLSAVAGGVLLATMSLAFTNMTNATLQVALLISILAGLLGLFDALRVMRLPDVAPSAAVGGAALG